MSLWPLFVVQVAVHGSHAFTWVDSEEAKNVETLCNHDDNAWMHIFQLCSFDFKRRAAGAHFFHTQRMRRLYSQRELMYLLFSEILHPFSTDVILSPRESSQWAWDKRSKLLCFISIWSQIATHVPIDHSSWAFGNRFSTALHWI